MCAVGLGVFEGSVVCNRWEARGVVMPVCLRGVVDSVCDWLACGLP